MIACSKHENLQGTPLSLEYGLGRDRLDVQCRSLLSSHASWPERLPQGDSIYYSPDAISSLALRCLYKRKRNNPTNVHDTGDGIGQAQLEIPKIAADSCRADDSALCANPHDAWPRLPSSHSATEDLGTDGLDWRDRWHAKLLAGTDLELSEISLVCFAKAVLPLTAHWVVISTAFAVKTKLM